MLDRLDAYQVTLDGNEQYPDPATVAAFLDRLAAAPGLDRLRRAILFLEQPMARAVTLTTRIDLAVPVEIDEADGDIAAFPAARGLGYRGVSSKSCKGFTRALLNRARVAAGGAGGFISAEDLTTQAGIAVQQDLLLATLVGATHVERNGHHYVDGMAGAPEAEQARFLAAHPDLYRRAGGRARARIRDGAVSLASVTAAPGLGSAVEPDWSAMTPMQWRPQHEEPRRPLDQPRHRPQAVELRRSRRRLPPPRHHHHLPLARPDRRHRTKEAARIVHSNGVKLTGVCRGGFFPAPDAEGRARRARRQPPRRRRGGRARRRLPGHGRRRPARRLQGPARRPAHGHRRPRRA